MLVFAFYLLSLGLLSANLDEGTGIDPHGGAHTTLRTDAGCAMDPNGHPCTQQLTTDEGNGLDPHGGRVTGQSDRGILIDPNG